MRKIGCSGEIKLNLPSGFEDVSNGMEIRCIVFLSESMVPSTLVE